MMECADGDAEWNRERVYDKGVNRYIGTPYKGGETHYTTGMTLRVTVVTGAGNLDWKALGSPPAYT